MQYQSNVDTAINVSLNRIHTRPFFKFFISLCKIVSCNVGTIPTVVLGIRLYSITCENTLYSDT